MASKISSGNHLSINHLSKKGTLKGNIRDFQGQREDYELQGLYWGAGWKMICNMEIHMDRTCNMKRELGGTRPVRTTPAENLCGEPHGALWQHQHQPLYTEPALWQLSA